MTGEGKKVSADQRKAFVGMVGRGSYAHSVAKAKHNESWGELEESFVETKKEELGANALVKKIAELKDAVKKAEDAVKKSEYELNELGFETRYSGDLEIRYGSNLHREMVKLIEEQIGRKEDVDVKFEKAQAKVLKAETAEEAAAIVESLL